MRRINLSMVAVAATLALTACENGLSSNEILSEEELTTDVAASAGDGIAASIATLTANELDGGLSGASVVNSVAANTQSLDFTRTRTCYNASDAVVANCTPLSSVRKIVTHVSIEGTRSGTHPKRGGGEVTWEGSVDRVVDDTLVRNFNGATPPAEVSRTHSGVATGQDVTSFTDGTISREATETFTDSIKAVTWNIPRSSNPFPVSGSIKRVLSATVVVTRGEETQTRNINRTITVTFPADAQGNVVLTVNDKTCNLNLVTRAVSNCQ